MDLVTVEVEGEDVEDVELLEVSAEAAAVEGEVEGEAVLKVSPPAQYTAEQTLN